MGKETLRVLSEESPDMADETTSDIRKPFLIMDDFNFVSFEGSVEGNNIRYSESSPFLTKYPENKFRGGNKLTIDGNRIRIFKGDLLLHEIETKNKNPAILDFS